jgi:hypothetical protein
LGFSAPQQNFQHNIILVAATVAIGLLLVTSYWYTGKTNIVLFNFWKNMEKSKNPQRKIIFHIFYKLRVSINTTVGKVKNTAMRCARRDSRYYYLSILIALYILYIYIYRK